MDEDLGPTSTMIVLPIGDDVITRDALWCLLQNKPITITERDMLLVLLRKLNDAIGA